MKRLTALYLLVSVLCLISCGSDSPPAPDNSRPEITSLATAAAIEDTTFSYMITFTDPDGPDTVITFEDYPGWLTASDNAISGLTPWGAEDTSFVVIVSDGSLADTLGVTVTVTHSDIFYLGFRPRSAVINVGDDTTLTVSINAVDSLFGIAFDIEFDTSVVSVDTTGALTVPQTSILYTDSTVYFYRAIPTGISVSVSKVNSSDTSIDDNVSGRGLLCQIKFNGKSAGSTGIVFNNVLIINDAGETNSNLDSLITKPSEITVQ